ncbi:MAG TPA: DUF4412 domain-containing protein [Crenalkalicoccus sp.]|nr:DUF4412 domain-containing protein [Crenalkalicoccus sp.]
MTLRPALLPAALLAFGLAPGLAAAQDRPPMHPTRDVSVSYRVEGGGPGAAQGGEMRLSWLAAEQKMRMDMPGGLGWSVTDRANGDAFMVMEQQHAIMRISKEMMGGNPMEPGPTARFTRGGTETLLGLSCTVWRYQEEDVQGEACITADGVMLRSRGTAGGQGGSMTATKVAYDRQDPARFRAPEGYRSMTMPGGSGPGAPGPGAPGGR